MTNLDERYFERPDAPKRHMSGDECEDMTHIECAGCIYDGEPESSTPCSDCWNGDGDGKWCYYEAKEEVFNVST